MLLLIWFFVIAFDNEGIIENVSVNQPKEKVTITKKMDEIT